MPYRRRRPTLRKRNYDYTNAGAYFITICAYQNKWLFTNAHLRGIIEECWYTLPDRFPTIRLDEWVIMPNHIHGIIWLTNKDRDLKPNLGAIVGAFKSLVAVRWLEWLHKHDPQRSGRIWHRNFHDQIIRNEHHLNAVRRYIRNNPRRWDEKHQ